MLHSLSHLLITEAALDCGYGASAIEERIYAFDDIGYGILLYTGGSGSEGRLEASSAWLIESMSCLPQHSSVLPFAPMIPSALATNPTTNWRSVMPMVPRAMAVY